MITKRTNAAKGLLAIAMLIGTASLTSATPQEWQMADQNEMMQQQFHNALKQHKTDAENRIASRIADIDRACELTEKQKLKFKVASKGAIIAKMAAATKQMVETSKQMGFEFDPDAEPKKEDENQNNMGFAMPFFGAMGAGSVNDVEEFEVWTSAVENILDKDQNDKWKAWVENRNAFQREVAINDFIAKADRKLLLSPEQRAQLTKYVGDEFGDGLMNAAKIEDQQMGMNMFFAGPMAGMPGQEPTEEKKDPVKEILNESQFAQWKSSFANQLASLEAMNGNGNMMGMMGMPAPLLIEAAGVIEEEEVPEEVDDDKDK